jgi:C1q domain
MNNIPSNIPDYSIPLIDTSGKINPIWWRFLVTLFNRSGGAGGSDIGSITIIVGKQGEQISELQAEEISKVIPVDSSSSAIDELLNQISQLRSTPDYGKRIDDLEAQAGTAPYTPPVVPSLPISAISNFFVYKTVAQAIPATTYTACNFDTKLFDDLAEFNTSTGTFIPSVAGTYIFAGGIAGTQTVVTRRILGLFVNGTERVRLQDNNGNDGGSVICGASAPVKLNAGDAVRLYYYTGIAENTATTQQTDFFGGHRIK